MKRFTFVVALAGACVGMAMAQSPRVTKLENPLNAPVLKGIEAEMPVLQKNVTALTPAAKFDFVKENQKRMMRKPAQVATLSAPVALPATEASEIGFIANWNEVEGANYYEVDVYRTYQTSLDTIYNVLYEDFYLTEPSTTGSYYNNYLWENAYRWNWGLIDGQLGDQCVLLPNDVEAGSELDTPELDLSMGGTDETGTIYLTLWVEGTVGDMFGVGYFYYDTESESYMTNTLGSIELEEASMARTYAFQEMPLSQAAGFFLYTMASIGNASDVKIKAVMVSQPVTAGSEFTTFYNFYQTQETSSLVFTMEKGTETEGITDEFMYGVFALDVNMSTGEINDSSEMSNLIVVGEESAVEGLTAGNDKIFVHDNLHVVLEKPATVDVYNMAGVRVMSVEGVEGDNEIALPASGAYVVKAGNTVAKVMK